MKYNLRKIMLRAWKNYRENQGLSFSECLHRAWVTAKAEKVNGLKMQKWPQGLARKPTHGAAGNSSDMK